MPHGSAMSLNWPALEVRGKVTLLIRALARDHRGEEEILLRHRVGDGGINRRAHGHRGGAAAGGGGARGGGLARPHLSAGDSGAGAEGRGHPEGHHLSRVEARSL